MYSTAFTAAVALMLSFLLTPLVRDAFLRRGLVDRPDGLRKLHGRPVPRVGGIPIAASYVLAYLVLLASPLKGGEFLEQALPLVWAILPAAALVFAVGLTDDVWGLRPAAKLAGQIFAALLACWAGVKVSTVAGYAVPDWLALPLTVLWLVACANAFNLIDGVDGLAAGVGLVATLTAFLAALLHQNLPLALATFPLAGALVAFLRYNFNPASIFLGDSGSLLVGFLLGCYGVIWSQKSTTILGMTAPLVALAVPLADTAIAVARRFLRGRPVFDADRGHVHHRLLDLGLGPRRVVLVLYAACGVGAAFSLLLSSLYGKYTGLVLVLFLAVAWAGIDRLNYDEFGAAKRMLFGGELRQMLNAQIALAKLERELARAWSIESCWAAIEEVCRSFGFAHAELHYGGRVFGRSADRPAARDSWHVYVPLSDRDYVLLSRGPAASAAAFVSPLADLLRAQLPHKLAALSASGEVAEGPEVEAQVLLSLARAIQSYDERFKAEGAPSGSLVRRGCSPAV